MKIYVANRLVLGYRPCVDKVEMKTRLFCILGCGVELVHVGGRHPAIGHNSCAGFNFWVREDAGFFHFTPFRCFYSCLLW